MGNYYGNMFGWGLGGSLMMIIFWGAIIFFIVWLVRELKGNNSSSTPKSKSSIDILKERYAKGEIDKQEFEEKKRDLIS